MKVSAKMSKVFAQCEPKMTLVHMEATKAVEAIFKFMLMSSESHRFFIIYVNEMGESHIYHSDQYLQ